MKTGQSFLINFSRGFVGLFLILFVIPNLAFGNLLSERTHKRLGQIHKLMERSDYSGALEQLDKLMLKSGGRTYDLAIIQQTYGFVYESMGQPVKAVRAFKSSLESGELPPAVAQGIRMNLASLYLGLNKNKQALDIFKEWHDIQKKPSAEALIFGGSLYAENEEYIQAISLINRAINLSRTPKDSWLRRAAAIYIKMGDYTKASKVLSTLVSNNPENVSHWKQLAASYYYSGNEEKALSVMLLAFEKSLFKTEKEILDLARLAASQNIPLTASEVLERGINDGIVPRNRESLILLGNIYIQAREYDRGIESLTTAADISNDSKLYLRVANLYTDLQQWDSVLKVLGEHLPDEPQLKSRGLLLKGIAFYENGRMDESRKAFRQASFHKETSKLASTWLEYIN